MTLTFWQKLDGLSEESFAIYIYIRKRFKNPNCVYVGTGELIGDNVEASIRELVEAGLITKRNNQIWIEEASA